MEAATVHQLRPSGEVPMELSLRDALTRIAELERQIANDYARRDAEDRAEGFRVTVEKQAREIGVLTRKVAEGEDPQTHPKGAEIVALIERWKRGTDKPTAKAGATRVKLVKARLKDGYPLASEDELPSEPTLELAIDGLCAYPFRVYDRRLRDGKPANRDDDLTAALKDEKHVEEMARLGFKARREGWTLEGGWPA